MILRVLSYPIIVFALLLSITEFLPVIGWCLSNIATYRWMLYGVAAYFIMQNFVFFKRNDRWRRIFAHEFAHTLVSMMLFRKIHFFRAAETDGVIRHSSAGVGDIFIWLAPYCLPYLTYAFLLLSIIGSSHMLYVFDIFVGFTLAFHIACFWVQTRPYQTDLKRYGYVRSYLFIAAALMFNFTIILLSIRIGIVDATTYLFKQYWNDIVCVWNMIF